MMVTGAGRLCEPCQQLDIEELLHSSPSGPLDRISLGSLTELLARKEVCDFCQLVFKYLRGSRKGYELPDEPHRRTVYMRTFRAWTSYMRACGYLEDHLNGESTSIQRLVESGLPLFSGYSTLCLTAAIDPDVTGARGAYESKDQDHSYIAVMYDPKGTNESQQYRLRPLEAHMDLSLVRQWLALCKNHHGNRCEQPPYLALRSPTSLRLIDTATREVVIARPDCQYAALSYVWGGPQLVATAEALGTLPWQLPGDTEVSATVRDAMILTAKLGLRYLWVDALCIVQDPPANADKTLQLGQMDRIYGCATVTIVAADSKSAAEGIPSMKVREPKDESLDLGGTRLDICQFSVAQEIDASLWNSRAWTYQERLLSKRCLVLGHKQVYWMCQCDVWCERVVAEPPVAFPSASFIPRPMSEKPEPPERTFTLSLLPYNRYAQDDEANMIEGYVKMVKEYTYRGLGYPSDGVNAVAGVLAVLSKAHPAFFRRMYHGLPEACFDFALLWTPREACARPSDWKAQPKIPSWTWAGWFGGVGVGIKWQLSLFWSGRSSVQPAVIWHLVDKQGTSRPIVRREDQDPGVGPRAVLNIDDESSTVPPGFTVDYNTLCMHAPTTPVDIIHEGGYYLHFLTSTTQSFHLGPKLPWFSADEMKTCPTEPYEICTANGDFAGTIILPPDEAQAHQFLDLVFLSYTSSFDFTINTKGKVDLKQQALRSWSVANVMLVRRMGDGTVERRHLARVAVHSWEAAELETEWILLA